MPLSPGTRLGPYEVLARLGAGGMGEVYRARDTRLGRDVAVKVLPQHLSSSPDLRARFEREGDWSRSGQTMVFGSPNPSTRWDLWTADVTPDGEGFLVSVPTGESAPVRLNVVLGWAGLLAE